MTMPAFVFADGELIEIILLPDVAKPFKYKGMDLFALPEDQVLRQLEHDDPTMRESNVFIIFFDLGLALTGFYDAMPEQKAITIFGHNHHGTEKRHRMQTISFL